MAEKSDVRPAKKLPENAPGMNPIMLIYQMRPNTSFQEVAEVGTPPNILFHIKCAVDGQEFVGIGTFSRPKFPSRIRRCLCSRVQQEGRSQERRLQSVQSRAADLVFAGNRSRDRRKYHELNLFTFTSVD